MTTTSDTRNFKQIMADVCTEHGVTEAQIKGRQGARWIVAARHRIIYEALASEGCRLSRVQIGERLGGRDHSTVIYGCYKYAQRNNKPFIGKTRHWRHHKWGDVSASEEA